MSEKKIKNFLETYYPKNPEKKFTVEKAKPFPSNGGTDDYKGSDKIAPYDLTNWLGLDVILTDNNTKTRYAFFISLQSFDYDSRTGNYHVLMDRVGVYMYHEDIVKKYNEIEDKDKAKDVLKPVNALAEMYTTNFDLPLSQKELSSDEGEGGLAELLEKFISNDPATLEKRIERIKVRRKASNDSIINTIKNFDEKAMNNKKFITGLIKKLEKLNKELVD